MRLAPGQHIRLQFLAGLIGLRRAAERIVPAVPEGARGHRAGGRRRRRDPRCAPDRVGVVVVPPGGPGLRVRRPPGSGWLRRPSGTSHGRRRANCFLGNFLDGTAGHVIPVATLTGQCRALPILAALIAHRGSCRPGDLGVSLRTRCLRIGRQLAPQNSVATVQVFPTALPVTPAITEINSNDDLELSKCFPASAAGSSARPQPRPS